MRVLMTGASGFIGRQMLKTLIAQDIEVVVIGRTRPLDAVQFIETDLLSAIDFETLMRDIAPTHLLHLAWYAEHGKFWTSLANLRWVEASSRLVESFCKAGGQHVVVAGTCAEYDWNQGYCIEDTTPLNPASLYGVAKNAAHMLAMGICQQFKVRCAWGRIFLPFGKNEANARLIPSLIDVYKGKRPPFSIHTNAYRDFLHVDDVCQGMLKLLTHDAQGAYNICSAAPTHLKALVETLAHLMGGSPLPLLELAVNRPHEHRFLIGNNDKLTSLGWSQALSLEKGLEMVIFER
jgi:nucleoside-diphosphate-sugar epimerase